MDQIICTYWVIKALYPKSLSYPSSLMSSLMSCMTSKSRFPCLLVSRTGAKGAGGHGRALQRKSKGNARLHTDGGHRL